MNSNTCSIVGRCRNRNTGRLTNRPSKLHKDLLGLSKLNDLWNRKKANRVFLLSQSKEFLDKNADDIIFDREEDADGEPILAQIYELLKNDIMSDITLGDIRQHLANEYHEGEYNYQEAYDNMINFNSKMKGSRTFMGTIRPQENGKYRFEIAYNTEEEQQALIQTISDRNTAEAIIKRLESLGVGIAKGVQAVYDDKGPTTIIGGLQYILGSENKQDVKELALKTGHFLIGALGMDHPIIKRLTDIVQNHPEVIRQLLEGTESTENSEEQILDKDLLGHLVGLYLRNWDKIKPSSPMQRFILLTQRALDWLYTKLHFTNKDFYKAAYDAKYLSYKIVKNFMGTNFKSFFKLDNLEDDYGTIFNHLQDSLKDLHLLVESSKDYGYDIHKNYKKEFEELMQAFLENRTLRKQDGGPSFQSYVHDKAAARKLLDMARFITNEILDAQYSLKESMEGIHRDTGKPYTMKEAAQVIQYNQELCNMTKKLAATLEEVAEEIKDIGTQDSSEAEIKEELSQVSQALQKVVIGYTTQGSSNGALTNIFHNYEMAIHKARGIIARKLLTEINGSSFVAIEAYVSAQNWHTIKRNPARCKNLAQELLRTDINPSAQFISRWIDSISDSPDIINQLIKDAVERQKHEANTKTLYAKNKLKTLYDKFRKLGYRETKMFYERYDNTPIFDIDTFYKKGTIIKVFNGTAQNVTYYKLTKDHAPGETFQGTQLDEAPKGQLTGNLISERNWGAWEAQYKIDKKAFEDKFFEEHKDIFYSKTEMYSNTAFIVAFGAWKEGWNAKHSTQQTLKDENGNILVDESGKEIKIYVPAVESDPDSVSKAFLYDNPAWHQLKKEDPEAFKWLEEYMTFKRELDNLLPKGCTNRLGVRAPQFAGTMTNKLDNIFAGEGSATRFGKMALRNFITYNLSLSPSDTEYGGEHNTYDHDDLYDSNGLIFDRAHSNALQTIERVPLFGVKKLKDIDELSTDLIHATLAYASMAYSYDCMNEIAGTVVQTAELLKTRQVNNDKQNKELNNVNTPGTYARLEDYIQQQIFSNYADSQASDANIAFRKLAGHLASFGSIWFLGWNCASACTNAYSAFRECVRESISGDQLTFKSFVKANFICMGQVFQIIVDHCVGTVTQYGSIRESNAKLTAFRRLIDATKENERLNRDYHIETLGYGLTEGWSYKNIAMLPYTITDWWMQSVPLVTLALDTKLKNVKTGEESSLWDAYVEDKKTNIAIPKGGYEAWKIKDDNLERVQSYLLEELRKKGSLDDVEKEKALYQYDSMGALMFDEEGNKILKDIYISWDNAGETRFLSNIVGITSRMYGPTTRAEGGAYMSLALGTALASLKRYAIGLIDNRFARARYDARTRTIRQGFDVTAIDLLIDSVCTSYSVDDSTLIGQLDSLKYSDLYFIGGSSLKVIYGILKFCTIVGTGGLFCKEYLRERGYSESQIRNVGKFFLEQVDPMVLDIVMHLCLPPEERVPIEPGGDGVIDRALYGIDNAIYKVQQKIENSFLGDATDKVSELMLQGYCYVLRDLLPGDKTVNDELLLNPDYITITTLQQYGTLPFSLKGILYYQTYRTYLESAAVNPLYYRRMFNEWKSLTSSMLPGISAVMDAGLLLSQVTEDKSEDDIIEEALSEGKTSSRELKEALSKYNNGAEVYTTGANKDWYKWAMHTLKSPLCPLRSGTYWMNGYYSKESHEYWADGGGQGINLRR